MQPHANSRTAPKKSRDIRLDFFRGLCLFIIFIAHMYGNPWASWIPARFGFSDATEIFVFCSGMASAIAFAATFERHGALVGFGRVAYRIWQVYWAHVSLFVLAIGLTIVTDDLLTGGDGTYLRGLQMENLFNENAKSALLGIVTLAWVPAYFDILPMYLAILVMLPAFYLLAQVSFPAAYMASLTVWLFAQLGVLSVPAPEWSYGSWFFNPFGWQLIFFTGFSFMKGWLPAPPRDRRLICAAIAYCVITLPLEWEPLLLAVPALMEAREAIIPLIHKGHEGPLRVIHFFSLAYLAYIAVGERGENLKGPVVEVIAKVGTQSLGVFMAGILLSFVAGPFLNVYGRTYLTVFIANAGGIAALIAVAYTVAWFKSAPWSQRPAPRDAKPEPVTQPPSGAMLRR